MPDHPKPSLRPERPFFSSGPCAKRPGWSPAVLDQALLGRSHRSVEGRDRLRRVIDETRALLNVPDGYQLAIVPGSDTGAFELAMWNLLGPRGVDLFAWDVFGRIWVRDAVEQLRLGDVRCHDAEPGLLPDLAAYDPKRDCVFTWNGTTTGVRVPNADWIAPDRDGLTLCDATSAIFAEDIDLAKIDCLTFSWQKVLGGEAAHGMVLLSPRALKRLKSYTPPWPLPKLFRIRDGEELSDGLFEGVTINTPSMMCVEDCLDALQWMRGIGGLTAAQAKASANADVVYGWADKSAWLRPLCRDKALRSHTSVCLALTDQSILSWGADAAASFCGRIADRLAAEGVAFDIAAYRGMPAGLRIWTGATVERADLEALMPWLDWACAETRRLPQ
jgi:phosphoserine aminotransferase